MKYPNGSMIQFGDLIWWDEGHCVGYVQVIAESNSEYESWGLDAPHIFVSNNHPFDAALLTGVAHDEACFKDEGIGPLTADEHVRLRQAIDTACESVAGLEYSTYSITTDVQHCQLVGWCFTFYQDSKELRKVRVPH
jgi:hypothetical protein